MYIIIIRQFFRIHLLIQITIILIEYQIVSNAGSISKIIIKKLGYHSHPRIHHMISCLPSTKRASSPLNPIIIQTSASPPPKDHASFLERSHVEMTETPPNPKEEAGKHNTLKYSLLGPSLTKAGQDSVDQQKARVSVLNCSENS